jgi:hypothetical protein
VQHKAIFFFHLRNGLDSFVAEEKLSQPSDEKRAVVLGFVVHMTTYLHELNTELQGKGKFLCDII